MELIINKNDLATAIGKALRAVPTKTAIPILEDFLFETDKKKNTLTITASDQETTIRIVIECAEIKKEGRTCIPAKPLTELLSTMSPETQITLEDKGGSLQVIWKNGQSTLPTFPAEDYPNVMPDEECKEKESIKGSDLCDAISKVAFATDESNINMPNMAAVLIHAVGDEIKVVATDSRRVGICTACKRSKGNTEQRKTVITKKSAQLLKKFLETTGEGEDDTVKMMTNDSSVTFKAKDQTMRTRLVVAPNPYPPYEKLKQPADVFTLKLPAKDMINTLKRIGTSTKLAPTPVVAISVDAFGTVQFDGEDTSMQTKAHETLTGEYDGQEMQIGFHNGHLTECLEHLKGETAVIRIYAANKPAFISDDDDENNTFYIVNPIQVSKK